MPTDHNRYLIHMDTRALGHLYTDCLVIGAGVAGMQAALSAAQAGEVRVLVKDTVTESNTYYAQGGIAAVLRPDDTFDQHVADTLKTGCGLCLPDVVDLVIRDAPDRIAQLRRWSAPFDMDGADIATGREGGHSKPRIVHAHGDATGEALAATLLQQVDLNPNIKIFDQCFCIDLLTDGATCLGVVCFHPQHGLQCIWARMTILATGGGGRLYRETTNPEVATADGLAMAYRAGAVLTDMEFVQFHPTTLYVAGAERTLITEALRGAGAHLLDRQGRRFMQGRHEMAELAPRDIVSRVIYQELARTGDTNVFLDVRHLGRQWLAQRFPTISKLCASFDINVDTDLIPVRPSAHYMIGGVKTDSQGRTNLDNLYCCGEAAATGLHGSNRLASNSLLEGLVFGKLSGEHAAHAIAAAPPETDHPRIVSEIPDSDRTRLDLPDVTNSLRSVMWRNVGIERQAQRLEETIEIIDFWRRYVMDKVFNDPVGWQCQNMLTVSRLIAQSALARRESRGVHFRSDHPETDDAYFRRHLDITPLPNS